jgi:tetratricopeptide (TPR) repeat protein
LVVVLCLLSFCALGQDVLSELDDAAARMQYAYFTDDPRALADSLDTLARLDISAIPGLKEYFQAYGQWKLGELYAEAEANGRGATGGAGKVGQECLKSAKAAIAEDARMVEAYAIQAICGAKPTGGDCSAKPLRTALEMEPQNPRVRLIALLCLTDQERITLATLQRARSLVATFEQAPPSKAGKPDWGQAEALTLLAQIYLDRGDRLEARDAVERALVIAPDYRKAQHLLQSVAAARTR